MDSEKIKEEVRRAYGAVARGDTGDCGCGSATGCCSGGSDAGELLTSYASNPGAVAREIGYSDSELEALPDGANLGLGCGNPGAIASLRPGETVLDLGSGAGMDCFLAAPAVGPTGRVIGVDMTADMIARANENLEKSEFKNIEFRHGEIESLPVDEDSVDVVISNCVLNLVPDKRRAFREIHRVLKPGGRMAVSDIVKLQPLPDVIENDTDALCACISGAMPIQDYLDAAAASGLEDVHVVSEADFGDMFFATDGPVSEKVREAFPDGVCRGYIASIKVTARKPA